VTGGGRGIGHAIARHLADAGHTVILTDIDAGARRVLPQVLALRSESRKT
jgi:NAD(P)-dependent dehydrogenase (short-subunit alcohol dehydrogenase family)